MVFLKGIFKCHFGPIIAALVSVYKWFVPVSEPCSRVQYPVLSSRVCSVSWAVRRIAAASEGTLDDRREAWEAALCSAWLQPLGGDRET